MCKDFLKHLNSEKYKLNEPMSLHTTVKIGGPADIFYTCDNEQDLINIITLAKEFNINFFIIGRGSNTLIGDKGIRGLVIKYSAKNIEILNVTGEFDPKQIEFRHKALTNSEGGKSLYNFEDLNYDEGESKRVEVYIESGIDMPVCINNLLNNGITGLQWFGGIPGCLGGWIYNNVHGGSRFVSEFLKNVKVLTEDNRIITRQASELDLKYDYSIFHTNKEIILGSTFVLYKGDTEKSKYVFSEWQKRKLVQPKNSLGSVFQNISLQDQERLNIPTPSIGYIIDKVLNLTGFKIGDAQISLAHANFIENINQATAHDYLEVIKHIQKQAKEKLNLDLKPEIFIVGEF